MGYLRLMTSGVITGSIVFAACGAQPQGMLPSIAVAPSARGYGPEVQNGFTRVRAATANFVNLDSAVAAGYERDVPQCLADPNNGGMGYHHINGSLIDAQIEVERPEILLYERREDGGYVLNGVEYIIPYSRWPRDSVAPMVLGVPLKRSDGLRLWYLHMWVWTGNAAGLFADWNPGVKCLAR